MIGNLLIFFCLDFSYGFISNYKLHFLVVESFSDDPNDHLISDRSSFITFYDFF